MQSEKSKGEEMADLLPVPPELQHLIEKREKAERRQEPRRDDEGRQDHTPPQLAPSELPGSAAGDHSDDEPPRQERRQNSDRRRRARREDDRE
jgi:hypothetical protein